MSESRPYQMFRPLTIVERDKLKESIRQHGVLVPIVVDPDGNIIDGHHRLELAEELGKECRRDVRAGLSDTEKLDLAETLNAHRRQQTEAEMRAANERKREKAAAYVREHPQASVRRVAAATGTGKTLAHEVKQDLVATGQVSAADTSEGRDGKRQKATKTKRAAKPAAPSAPDEDLGGLEDLTRGLLGLALSPEPEAEDEGPDPEGWTWVEAVGRDERALHVPDFPDEGTDEERNQWCMDGMNRLEDMGGLEAVAGLVRDGLGRLKVAHPETVREIGEWLQGHHPRCAGYPA